MMAVIILVAGLIPAEAIPIIFKVPSGKKYIPNITITAIKKTNPTTLSE